MVESGSSDELPSVVEIGSSWRPRGHRSNSQCYDTHMQMLLRTHMHMHKDMHVNINTQNAHARTCWYMRTCIRTRIIGGGGKHMGTRRDLAGTEGLALN